MKALLKTLFAAYLLVLLWLVLFKLSGDPIAVLNDFHTRSLNLIPFTRAYKSEMIANFIAFVPFGVLLGVNFKQAGFWYKVAVIFGFSLAVEVIQFATGIGVADITDLITNTLGGLVGLAAYVVLRKPKIDRPLDRCILVIGTLLMLAVVYLRIFVFMVKY